MITNLTCPEGEECTVITGSSGCGSYGGGYAVVTCVKCMLHNLYLFLSHIYSPSIDSSIKSLAIFYSFNNLSKSFLSNRLYRRGGSNIQ